MSAPAFEPTRRRTALAVALLVLAGAVAAFDGWQAHLDRAAMAAAARIAASPPTMRTAGDAATPSASASASASTSASSAFPPASASASASSPAWAVPSPREARLVFAEASALAAAGRDDDALRLWRRLVGSSAVDSGGGSGDDGDTAALARRARYNGANLLLRRAIALQAGPTPGEAIAPIELAKEWLRDVLRAEPDHWGARYNLERAQRLLPDPEGGVDEGAAPRGRERAPTTARGVSQGLP